MNNGLDCLVDLLRFHGIAADPSQLRHAYGLAGHGELDFNDLIRIARGAGLKARAIHRRPEQLKSLPLPAIVSLTSGRYLLLGKVLDDKLLVLEPGAAAPVLMPRTEFESQWDGGVILAAKRASLGDVARRFDIGWFISAMHKYRWLLGEVLLASFFLQVFALITPLFFQVIIDKVLVHRGVSTLEVLIIGLATVAVFETVLSALRTYIFADTTNRIDVELGARLFRHLLALPLNYFQTRRVGDSVARVRELENIRTFITSSALTLVIDILFTFVFVAVMLIYSVWLTTLVLLSLPLYVGISVWATPLFRRRLDEKFKRGAENQSFLVESVTGVETLKAMAVEPQLQRRWEEQLAGYVGASFRVTRLANVASQAFQMVNKITTAGILYFGALAV